MSYDSVLSVRKHLLFIEGSPDHWWVTTLCIFRRVLFRSLKGHQIIGELRLGYKSFCSSSHILKGHQIIGELRLKPFGLSGEWRHWRVTRSLVSYDQENLPDVLNHLYWRVTRSLVSYDGFYINLQLYLKLKGHQIIGELRHIDHMLFAVLIIEGSPDHWWVTTSSYFWYRYTS